MTREEEIRRRHIEMALQDIGDYTALKEAERKMKGIPSKQIRMGDAIELLKNRDAAENQ